MSAGNHLWPPRPPCGGSIEESGPEKLSLSPKDMTWYPRPLKHLPLDFSDMWIHVFPFWTQLSSATMSLSQNPLSTGFAPLLAHVLYFVLFYLSPELHTSYVSTGTISCSLCPQNSGDIISDTLEILCNYFWANTWMKRKHISICVVIHQDLTCKYNRHQ